MTITRRSLLAAMGGLAAAPALAALPEIKPPVTDPAARLQGMFDEGVVHVEAKRVGSSTWERIMTTKMGRRADAYFPLEAGTYEFRVVIDLPGISNAAIIAPFNMNGGVDEIGPLGSRRDVAQVGATNTITLYPFEIGLPT